MAIAVIQGVGSKPATLTTKSITENGTYNASSDNVDGYSSVNVNVPPTLFRKLVDGSITTVTADDLAGVTVIGTHAFQRDPNSNPLESIEMPDSIVEIKGDAFYDARQLSHLVLSPNITTFGNSSFRNCFALTEFIFPDACTTIGDSVLFQCYVTRVIIGTNITSIGGSVFNRCTKLKQCIIKATTPPQLGSSAFFMADLAMIYVPTPDTYKVETNWVSWASRIFPLVNAVSDLSGIDTTTYTKACVIGTDESYKEYTYDGSQWNEVV